MLLDGKLLTVPHSKITSLIDLGCGSAIWTTAVAATLPHTHVVGVDITPPEDDSKLQNLQLITANIEQPWSFTVKQANCYDIITLRVLISAIHSWPLLFERCFEHLQPGGWIEVPDVTIGTFSEVFDWRKESSPLMRWYQCYRKGAAKRGIDGFANLERKKYLAAAGFINVSEKFFTCYLSEQSVESEKDKKIARLTRENMFGLLESVTKAMHERGEWDLLQTTGKELDRLKEEAKDDILQNSTARKYHWT